MTTIVLLNNIVHGTPSGNYDGSSAFFTSEPVEAANYYQGQGSIQTIFMQLTGFEGKIRLVATLGDDPGQAAWFELEEFDYSAGPATVTVAPTYTGSFVWVRAEVTDFAAGTINTIAITY